MTTNIMTTNISDYMVITLDNKFQLFSTHKYMWLLILLQININLADYIWAKANH